MGDRRSSDILRNVDEESESDSDDRGGDLEEGGRRALVVPAADRDKLTDLRNKIITAMVALTTGLAGLAFKTANDGFQEQIARIRDDGHDATTTNTTRQIDETTHRGVHVQLIGDGIAFLLLLVGFVVTLYYAIVLYRRITRRTARSLGISRRRVVIADLTNRRQAVETAAAAEQGKLPAGTAAVADGQLNGAIATMDNLSASLQNAVADEGEEEDEDEDEQSTSGSQAPRSQASPSASSSASESSTSESSSSSGEVDEAGTREPESASQPSTRSTDSSEG